MTLRLFCAGAAALLLASSAQAQDGTTTPGSIKGDAAFTNTRAELVRLVRRDGLPGRNDFCVVAYRRPDLRSAWIYWPQKRQLAQWTGGDLLLQWRPLDLATDVVGTDEEVGTSTYLVTRAWVENLVSDCYRYGEWFRLRR